MKYFDSHCHLDIDPLSQEIPDVIERAGQAGVTRMINVATSLRGSERSVELANSYPNVWASVGLHPHDAETTFDLPGTIEKLREMASDEKVVAIGEIGLDYFGLSDQQSAIGGQKKKQKELFIAQLELAKELKLPVIIHIRDAWEDFFTIIRNSKLETRNSSDSAGIVHCFTGDAPTAKKLVDLGFYVGFTGFVTFEQSKFEEIREAVKIVPLDKLLLETDAPFLAPEPYRGKTNEPAFVVRVGAKVAELKCLPFSEVAENTFKNTEKLFNIK